MSIVGWKRLARILELLFTLDIIASVAACSHWGRTSSDFLQLAIFSGIVVLCARLLVQRQISAKQNEAD